MVQRKRKLIFVWSQLGPDTVFLVGGSGPDTEKYKKIISDNQLQDRVLLLGRIPQDMIANYFSAADVFCFPSTEKSEAFGDSIRNSNPL